MEGCSRLFATCLSACVILGGCAAASQRSAQRQWITYEEFGAVGDGVHDDFKAIVKAHAAANRLGLPVRAGSGKTYYIGPGDRTAVIKTDVDFGSAQFIIDDVDCERLTSPVFEVRPSASSFKIKGVKSLAAGQMSLDAGLARSCLVHVMDSTKRVYIRKGNNRNDGVPKQEYFLLGSDGTVDPGSAIVWDYDRVTSMVAFPVDEDTLHITGGIFTTIANQMSSEYQYHYRGICVKRSNVTISSMTHYVTGEFDHGAPYYGFITILEAAYVTVRDCIFTGHKTYYTTGRGGGTVGMGSYDITARGSVHINLECCTQTNSIDDKTYWGTFSSNFCKDIRMEDCVLSRFDAHMGVRDVTLKRCTLGYMGVQAVGFGTLLIEDCQIRRPSLVVLRQDYGSFWDGEVIIRRCTLRPVGEASAVRLIDGKNMGDHDFGYEWKLPSRVIVEGLVIDDASVRSKSYKGPSVLSDFGRTSPADCPEIARSCEGVSLEDVSVTSGKALRLIH